MKYENDLFEIEYTKMDLDYIEDMINLLNNESGRILDFFNINKLKNKLKIKSWDSLEDYRNNYRGVPCDWGIADTSVTEDEYCINFINLDEIKKLKYLFNKEAISKIPLHEFVHICHREFNDNFLTPFWVKEGLATALSNQYLELDLINYSLKSSLEDLLNDKVIDYTDYYVIFKYILDNYDKDYILALARFMKGANEELPRIYEEVNNYLSNTKT